MTDILYILTRHGWNDDGQREIQHVLGVFNHKDFDAIIEKDIKRYNSMCRPVKDDYEIDEFILNEVQE